MAEPTIEPTKLVMETSDFTDMLDTVKSAIPTFVAVAPDDGNTPGIIINVYPNEDGGAGEVQAKASSETQSITSARYPIISGGGGLCEFNVPAAWIMAAKARLPSDKITMETTKSNDVLLKSGRFRTTSESIFVPIFSGDMDIDKSFWVDPSVLLEGFPRALKCCAKNDFRHALNGVYFEQKGGTLKMTATNGHMGTLYTTKLDVDDIKPFGVNLPRKSVVDVLSLVKRNPDKGVNIIVSESGVVFNIENGPLFTSPLINGKFPNCSKLFVDGKLDHRRIHFDVDRKTFAEAVQRVSALSKESNAPIKLKCLEGKSNMSITLPEDAHNGRRKAKDEVIIERHEGYDEEIEVYFNSHYILDLLYPSSHDKVSIAVAPMAAKSQSIFDLTSGDPAIKVLSPINI